MEFQGKRVLVTGGARGLGEAIVRQFVDLGATVFALDKEEALLVELKSKIPQVSTIAVDLRDWEATQTAVRSVAPIHHLVNNAGIAGTHSALDVSQQVVDMFLDVNFKSVLNVSQCVAQGLIEHGVDGGTIVNISSVLGSKPFAGSSMYCCTKAAVTMLTKCLAVELGPKNIRVNCIRPTWMTTGLVNDPANMKKLLDMAVSRQIIKKEMQTNQAADLVIFLSSSKSAMITAEDVVIDAGLLCT